MGNFCILLEYILTKKMTEKTIILSRVFHKNRVHIGLHYPFDPALTSLVKKLNARWSQTNKCWYVNDTAENIKEIYRLFSGVAEIKRGESFITPPLPPGKNNSITADCKKELSDEVKSKVLKFKYHLLSRRYSESTVGTYIDALQSFLRFYADKPVNKITNNDIVVYNNEYILKNNLSASYQNQVVNAIKLFFSRIEHTKMHIAGIERPKKPRKLPNVLSLEEVETLLNSLKNVKHKCMLALIYSAGLRRSELINLKIEDVDSKRMMISIRTAKGNKDRFVPLAETTLNLLREYYKVYKPNKYLFEGQAGGKYSDRSLLEVFHKAKDLAHINKNVTLHTLRHSYATHLLEGGVNLRYIQEILGHKSPKTTEIYTHVSSEALSRVISPIERLKLKNEK